MLFSLIFSDFFMKSDLFFFNDTATTEIYTLSLHDALPISRPRHLPGQRLRRAGRPARRRRRPERRGGGGDHRSEEHTSELQSRPHLVCRLLLEKKSRRRMVSCGVSPAGISSVTKPARSSPR